MKPWMHLWLAMLSIAPLPTAIAQDADARSARPSTTPSTAPVNFDRSQSAALFVGVRRFTHDQTLTEVKYAVDDAIDLASVLALDRNVSLVTPRRVVLALSGTPQKPASQQRLDQLIAAGATVSPASQADILTLLARQAGLAGKEGLLILSFASHGFSRDGTPYVLAASSLFEHPETSISTAKLVDIAAGSDAARSLIFLDACRENITTGARAIDADAEGAAPLIEGMSHVDGQVVFYAAAAGKYAYDDDEKQNGVFTTAVIEGLRCKAATDERGLITVETLAAYVETNVRSWIQKHKDPSVRKAIQVNMDGATKTMPLSVCARQPRAVDEKQPSAGPVTVAIAGTSLSAMNEEGTFLWRREVKGPVAHTEVVDLDGDGANEVVAGVGRGGEDSGKIIVFDAAGKLAWSADTNAPSTGDSIPLSVKTFTTGDLFRKGTRQIVALSIGEEVSSPSLLTVFAKDGKQLASYRHPGALQDVVIATLTARTAPRIIATAVNTTLNPVLGVDGPVATIFMLDPKTIRGDATPLWYGTVLPSSQTIDRLEIVDHDNDGRRDIAITTSTGHTFHLDFDGRIIATSHPEGSTVDAHFGLIAPK
jgi:Caspase domain